MDYFNQPILFCCCNGQDDHWAAMPSLMGSVPWYKHKLLWSCQHNLAGKPRKFYNSIISTRHPETAYTALGWYPWTTVLFSNRSAVSSKTTMIKQITSWTHFRKSLLAEKTLLHFKNSLIIFSGLNQLTYAFNEIFYFPQK